MRVCLTFSWHLAAVACVSQFACVAPANAQRTGDNALRAADDAFGTSIGQESIGLYTAADVRGFSPFAAGNVRIEGMYADAVVGPNGRLVGGSTIRVGISAQGYPFPAPTGIADYRLRVPGDRATISAIVSGDTYGGRYGEVGFQLPIFTDHLSLGGGIQLSHDVDPSGGTARHGSAALIARWRPLPNLEILPFWSRLIHRDEEAEPRIIVAGPFLPPEIPRGVFFSQRWARESADDSNYGTIARWSTSEWAVAAGLFRSSREPYASFSDQFIGTSAQGVASRHRTVATRNENSVSNSGELRVSRELREGPRFHRLHLAVRGRDQIRRYGGSSAAELGPTSIGETQLLPEPVFTFGPQSHDHVRQFSAGIAYEGRWAKIAEVSLGLQKTNYSKEIREPGRIDPVTRAKPWLFNGALAVHVSPAIALYAGYTRGLEESPVAPDVAINRNEAPPAIRTRQYDAGLRWAITPKLKIVAGVFNVEKPYFSLDSNRLYRQLGTARHGGVELSMVGDVTSNLTILGGAVLLDAKVSGEAVSAGLIGPRPVGSVARRLILNGEYRPPYLPGFSLDGGITSVSERVANTANTLTVPPVSLVQLGVRYRWSQHGTPLTLRAEVTNLLNTYSWEVRASNTFSYTDRRRASIRLVADF